MHLLHVFVFMALCCNLSVGTMLFVCVVD